MDDGPRERLRRHGPAALSDAELLALVLGTGSTGEHVTVLAARVLQELGGCRRLAHSSIQDLLQVRGIGATKASRLVAVAELGRRMRVTPRSLTPLEQSEDVYAIFGDRLRDAKVERFFVLSVDARNRPIAEHEVARGGRIACQVDTAEVFRLLLRDSASGVVFVHNHPSGDPAPSQDDIALTQALVAAAHLLQIRVLDHVVVGAESHFSFQQSGLLGRIEAPPPAP